MSDELKDVEEILKLQSQLDLLIKQEEYEKASALKEKIEELRSGGGLKQGEEAYAALPPHKPDKSQKFERYYVDEEFGDELNEKEVEWMQLECCDPMFVGVHAPHCENWSIENNKKMLAMELRKQYNSVARALERTAELIQMVEGKTLSDPNVRNDFNMFCRLTDQASSTALVYCEVIEFMHEMFSTCQGMDSVEKLDRIAAIANSLVQSGAPTKEAFREAKRIVEASWNTDERPGVE